MKVGVLYVGPKQRTQQEILRNEHGSAAYSRFLARLGWEVDLLTHRGYAGVSRLQSPQSVEWPQHDLLCQLPQRGRVPCRHHDAHQAERSPANRQETSRRQTTSFTSFGTTTTCTSTIRRPLPATSTTFRWSSRRCGATKRVLYTVKIHSKDKVPPFGPIQSGMVIAEADLVPLVRQTAMNANRVCRSQVRSPSILISLTLMPYMRCFCFFADFDLRSAVSHAEEAAGRNRRAVRRRVPRQSPTGNAVRDRQARLPSSVRRCSHVRLEARK